LNIRARRERRASLNFLKIRIFLFLVTRGLSLALFFLFFLSFLLAFPVSRGFLELRMYDHHAINESNFLRIRNKPASSVVMIEISHDLKRLAIVARAA
jgi:hypothetical protein